MSVNDVTSGILAPALQVKRLQKRELNQKLKQTKIAVLVYLNGEISYSIVSIFLFSSNLCCVTHLEQIQFTFFHLLRFPLRTVNHSIPFQRTAFPRKTSDIGMAILSRKASLVYQHKHKRLDHLPFKSVVQLWCKMQNMSFYDCKQSPSLICWNCQQQICTKVLYYIVFA